MSLSLAATYSAINPGNSASFLANGGTPAYVYSVLANGAGGSINASSGIYTAPAIVNPDAAKAYDTIQVQDSLGATVTLRILIANALGLFRDILQRELGLDDNHCYFWNQKILQPTDSGLYVALSVEGSKPFGNTNAPDGSGSGLDAVQSVNMLDVVGIDIISRSTAARDRKAEVIMALNSNYAQAQQEKAAFRIGQLAAGAQFVALNEIDGAAIPYRFRISVNLQYFVTKTAAIPYFDDFSTVAVTTEP